MKRFAYSVSTNTIWTSFDYGTVLAHDVEEAEEKAKKLVSEALDKCNKRLKRLGMTIEIDLDQLVITPILEVE